MVESWLKDSSSVMDAELYGTEWQWFGCDRQSRRGGGLGYLVKRALKPRTPKPGKECLLWLEVEFCEKWYIALIYLIPHTPGANLMAILTELARGIVEYSGKGKIVIMGDFNARVGNLPNSMNLLTGSHAPFAITRTSKDQKVSSLGRKVMATLNSAGMVLLNGVGGVAEFTTHGNTVIDFIWAQSGDLHAIEQFTVVEEKVKLSDHFMVTATFKLPGKHAGPQPGSADHRRVRWNVNSRGNPDHWSNLQKIGNRIMAEWTPRMTGLHSDQKMKAEAIWDTWLGDMQRTVELGLGYVQPTKPRRQDHDAQLAKLIELRNAARKTRDRVEGKDRASAQEELRTLHKKVRQRLEVVEARVKKRRSSEIQANSSKNPRVYWDLLKKTVGLGRKKHTLPDEVIFDGVVASGDKVLEVWREAFRRLFAVDHDEKTFRKEFLEEIKQEVSDELRCSNQLDSLNKDINKPIECKEVHTVITNLKLGKAAGVDSLMYEIFKFGGEGIHQATARLCNEIFELERIPKDWARGLIFPLFKDGDNRIPDNYRGITLLSVVGKIYSSVLNNRVTSWCEKNGVLSEEQAAFRAGRSTVDHILTVSELVRSRKVRRKETHCAFLDIRKAYDMLDRDALWKRLIDVGLRGKLWRVLRNLYDVVESSVLVGHRRTEWFQVEAGVRQGCILSPILFAIFIDGLVRAVKRVRVTSTLEGIKLNILLFADDVILLADSRKDLQKLLDAVYEYSQKWRFKWNVLKSKVMRFGSRKAQKLQYYLGFQALEVVKSFKYLGVEIQENLSWTSTKRRFAEKAKTRIPLVTKAVIEGLSVRTGESR